MIGNASDEDDLGLELGMRSMLFFLLLMMIIIVLAPE